MRISDWPETERPREKLLRGGPASLSDAELLAIFLRTGTRGASAVDLARALLHRLGGLRGILEAPRAAFCAIPGMGDSKYAQLQAIRELAQRSLEQRLQRADAFTD